jgi:serine protease Do
VNCTRLPCRPCKAVPFAAILLSVCFVIPVVALPPPSALDEPLPGKVAELKTIQEQVKKVIKQVMPATVGIRVGGSQGSGVIVTADGYVLTAAHVAAPADRVATVILPDGRKLKAKTLGANRAIDAGLVKIEEEGDWPHVEMGNSSELERGQWCVCLGHPGGYQAGRPPVVRLGRILECNAELIQSECTLVGGDSGGPLFDLHGQVIGIHSRIGNSIAANVHVPVDAFRDGWDRLTAGEVWGGRLGGKPTREPYLGVRGDQGTENCRVREIVAGSPAEKAGLQPGDVITGFAGKAIGAFDELVAAVQTKRPGEAVVLEVQRGGEVLTLRAVLGRRPVESE